MTTRRYYVPWVIIFAGCFALADAEVAGMFPAGL
jgi:hypothetical protein